MADEWETFFRVHQGLDREGPGSVASTRRALAACGELPDDPVVIDFGCGPGPSALTLADTLRPSTPILAVDTHAPFLAQLERRAEAAGLSAFVETRCGSMLDVARPVPADLVWCEGAAYLVGVRRALEHWATIATPDARVVFTELVWLVDAVPDALRSEFEAEYPDVGDVELALERTRAAGWRVLEHFVLPSSDWATYYDPLRARVAALRATLGDEPDGGEALRAMLDATDAEADLYDRHGSAYGYVMVAARRAP